MTQFHHYAAFPHTDWEQMDIAIVTEFTRGPPLAPGSLQQPGSQEGARLKIYFLGLSSFSRSKRRHIGAPVCLEEGQGKQQVAGVGVGGREASD